MFLKIIFTGIFFIAVMPLDAQVNKFSGRIRDAATLEPIPFARLFFKQHKNLSILSDMDGKYSFDIKLLPDTIILSASGYLDLILYLKSDTNEKLQLFLDPDKFYLNEVVVTARKEDQAYEIIRKVLANKKINHKYLLEQYGYENYKKLKFGIKNVNEQFKHKKFFRSFNFILNNIDSTEEEPYLPIFFMETLSNYYYQKKDKKETEVVVAEKVSGISNSSITTLLDEASSNFYIYDDVLPLFSKSFISPVANNCFSHYKYELADSILKDGFWQYKIKYWPKKVQELTFTGNIWICDTLFSVKEIDGALSKTANLNFITSLFFHQSYTYYKKQAWLLGKEQMVVNGEFFIPHEFKAQKFIAKKISSNKFLDSITVLANHINSTNNVKITNNELLSHDWKLLRHDTLTNNEQAIYSSIDSIKKVPAFKNLLAIFTGYLNLGKFEIGPYYRIYSFNAVEGNRLRLGLRTNPNFSKHVLIEGYGAYGFRDKQWKYGSTVQYYLNKNPRRMAGVSFKHDVEQLGILQNNFHIQDNFLNAIFRIFPFRKLNRVEEIKLFVENEWFSGFSNRLTFRNSTLSPLGTLKYQHEVANEKINIAKISIAEASVVFHLCPKEKFINGEYNRLSLGGPYPAFDAVFTTSIPKLGSDYNYKKVAISIQQHVGLKRFGYFKYYAEAGKIFGLVPFPLFEYHNGNQTFFYDPTSFNTMNFFEFASDQYSMGSLAYHLDGLIFNKIPLFRKLKFREVVSCRGVIGSIHKKNLSTMILPDNLNTPDKGFMEAGIGIENIFRFFSIDGIWRLSYLNNPDATRFAVKGSFKFDF